MNMQWRTWILAAAVLTGSSSIFAAAQTSFSIPKIDNIQVDGNGGDWGDRGFRVEIMTPPTSANHGMPKADDMDGRFCLAWDDRGLLLLVTVLDDKADEVEVSQSWQADSIELFVAEKVGGTQRVQFLISPGCDAKHPEMATYANDQRPEASKEKFKATITAARTRQKGGYTIEALIPWENIGIKSAVGQEMAFQIYVNDRDDGGYKKKLVWYPRDNASSDSNTLYTLRLAEKPDPAIDAVAVARYEHFRRTTVNVIAARNFAGKSVSTKLGAASVAGKLDMVDGRAQTTLNLPLPQKENAVEVVVGGKALPDFTLPDYDTEQSRQLVEQNMAAKFCVFEGMAFPPMEFVSPNLVEDLAGPYVLTCRYFDGAGNEVESAAKPGRYGAVATATFASGQTTTRFISLYRSVSGGRWWFDRSPATVTMPREWGIAPEIVAAFPQAISDGVRESFYEQMSQSTTAAALLAGLSESDAKTQEGFYNGPFEKDRQYWVMLKRKLDGNDKRFTQAVRPPQMVEGTRAPVLHEGSMASAGMKEDTREKLDLLFKEWAEKSGEPFNVCIVRHGVIIIDAAYGTRDGKPMTTETRSWVASISKAISGTAMMTLVDQGLVSLNDDVSKYLPVFAATSYKPKIRNLYTHTAGLWSHRGDFDQDLDQRLAMVADSLKVGQRHEYNGMSLALGSRVLEAVSGKSLPQFYNEQLFTPLGMKNTESYSASYLTFTTAHDLAILGQMLLNKGAYGDKRYLRPETVEAMKPRKISDLVPGSEIEWGIGLVWMNSEKTILGHGSASSSTFWFEPSRDMVITITRNDTGALFSDYQKRMKDLITAQINEK